MKNRAFQASNLRPVAERGFVILDRLVNRNLTTYHGCAIRTLLKEALVKHAQPLSTSGCRFILPVECLGCQYCNRTTLSRYEA